METEKVSWPPLSAQDALLSSPTGRKKFADNAMSNTRRSPSKQSAGGSTLLERLRAARVNNDFDILTALAENDDVDEDEETLRLQLAAIEAKLKLRKIQQNKILSDAASSPSTVASRPQSVNRSSAKATKSNSRGLQDDHVEVGLSPIKRSNSVTEPRSPSRVVLGIDKGMRGTDVSLKRARTIGGSSGTDRKNFISIKERSNIRHDNGNNLTRSGSSRQFPKSFSERMADTRERQETEEQRRLTTNKLRSTGFKINQTEIDSYRKEAEWMPSQPRARSPAKDQSHMTYSRDEIMLANHKFEFGGRLTKKDRALPETQSRAGSKETNEKPDTSLFEAFSQTQLSSRVLPHSFLERTLPESQFTTYRLPDLLKVVKSPVYELPENVIDFVVFAIVASKSTPMDQKITQTDDKSVGSGDWERKWEDGSQNTSRFMAFTLTDLKWTITLYLFGTAVPRYHRLATGTVVAILNPSIVKPRKGKQDSGAFSLSLNNGDDTVLEIGRAQHLGHCTARKKDGSECGDWIDSSKTDICEWHLNYEISKTQASRMGVNTGTNGFGKSTGFGSYSSSRGGSGSKRDKQGLLPTGPKYDPYTGSHIYMTKSNLRAPAQRGTMNHPSNGSTAQMLDRDDLFLAEGTLSRDKKAILKKRTATQKKEHEIAKQLTQLNSTSAGAEYLREKTRADTPKRIDSKSSEPGSLRSALSTKANILSAKSYGNEYGKRAADSVRLSPIKKTRFLTDRGIREAGRESLGTKNDVYDDDDLDIV